ncbi:unnamed protein product [Symbiodinium sp. KB8]|nr:unnamed protein product [Symbiodinium sp. KB8]
MASRPRKGSEARQQPKRILVPAVSKNARFIEFDAARLKMDRALQSTDCLIAFMRTRAEMEAKLHKDLAELAARDLRESGIPGAVAGTFGDLRGDVGNEAAQHGHMAESMRVDIVEPLEQWKLTLTPMHQAVLGAQSQHSALVSASEQCLASFTEYMARRRRAVDACVAAAISTPADMTWNPPPHTQSWDSIDAFKKRTASAPETREVTNSGLQGSAGAGLHSARSTAAEGTATSSGGSGSVVSRLRTNFTSMFGSASDKLTALRRIASDAIAATYAAIEECQTAWARYDALIDDFERSLRVATVSLKSAWKEYTDTVLDAGRKFTVIHSSLLANLQYDTQMLAGHIDKTQALFSPTPQPADSAAGAGGAFSGASTDGYTAESGSATSIKLMDRAMRSDASGELLAGDSPMLPRTWMWKAAASDATPLLPQVRKALRTEKDALDRFVWAMDAQRAARPTLLPAAFAELVSLMLCALDVAAERQAFSQLRGLMVIAQTFSTALDIDGAEASLPLRVAVQDHVVWRDLQFWESSLFDSLGSEMAKAGQAGEGEEMKGASEAVAISQLTFYAYNMMDFSVPESDIQAIMRKFSEFTALSQAGQDQLATTISAFSVERSQDPAAQAAAAQAQAALAVLKAGLGSVSPSISPQVASSAVPSIGDAPSAGASTLPAVAKDDAEVGATQASGGSSIGGEDCTASDDEEKAGDGEEAATGGDR